MLVRYQNKSSKQIPHGKLHGEHEYTCFGLPFRLHRYSVCSQPEGAWGYIFALDRQILCGRCMGERSVRVLESM